MNVKKIDPKLYKAIMMAFQYQINCELTPKQCKELVDFIDNPLEVEEVCEWAHKKFDNHWDEYTPITCCKTAEEKNKFETLRLVGMGMEYKFCPNCGKKIVCVEKDGEK